MSDVAKPKYSYVVGDRVYWVSTIDYRNEGNPYFSCIESGIRDISRVQDGRAYPYEIAKDLIPFTLCQHDIYPIEDGHAAVVKALKAGIEPEQVCDYLKGRGPWKYLMRAIRGDA